MKKHSRYDYDRDLKNHRATKSKSKFILPQRVLFLLFTVAVGIFAWLLWEDYSNEQVSVVNGQETMQDEKSNINYNSNSEYERDNKIVCIDAGHGGNDVGAEYQGKYEKDYTLMIAKLVQQNLEKAGITVVMTRTTDVTLELSDRVRIAQESHAGILVSIHRNYYAGGNSVRGIEAWIHSSEPADSKTLANNILSELKTVSGATIRGLKKGTMADASTNYYINNHSACTSCILELGFITNSSDNELVTTKKSQCAEAIANGILNYIKQAE